MTTREDVLWCQLHNWYPIFKRYCLQTEFLQLDQDIWDFRNDAVFCNFCTKFDP